MVEISQSVERGSGIGLRIPHIQYILQNKPVVPWFEVHPCNFLRGGLNRQLLYQVAEHYPLSFHGVNLNLAGIDSINQDYLHRLKILVDEVQPFLISDHACFTALDHHYAHDLLPIPYTEASVNHMVSRVQQVQDTLKREILLENVSRYVEFANSTLSEADFLNEVSKRSGCQILLDLNNAYVNQLNLGIKVADFLSEINQQKVAEVHLAGHSHQDEFVVDTHNQRVCPEVWEIYRGFTQTNPNIPCLIEWDSELPDFEVLEDEREAAQRIIDRVQHQTLSQTG